MSRMKSQVLIAVFCAVAAGGLVPVWNGAWLPPDRHGMIAAARAADPVPAAAASAAVPAKVEPDVAAARPPGKETSAGATPSPSTLLDQARKLFPPERGFDPLDLTPDRIRVLEQAYQLIMTLRARDVELAARERALEAARLELEARILIVETDVTAARDAYRQAVRDELAERERAVNAKLEQISRQEEALGRLKAQMRRDVGEQFDKIVAAYQAMKPKRAARVLEEKDPADVAAIMFLLPDDQRARILSEMDPALVGAILKGPFAEELDAARPGRNGRPAQRP